jgi:endonuclease YncB( thermonuclease family)
VKARLTVYNCEGVRAIDGDSFLASGVVDPIAPDVTAWTPRVRLVFTDTPERGETGWSEAKTALEGWLMLGPFNLICYGRDKYGRLLADAERGEGLLSDFVVESGLGKRLTVQETAWLLLAE